MSLSHMIEKIYSVALRRSFDPTLNQKLNKDARYALVFIYPNRFENIPILHRIAFVVRIHTTNLRLYAGKI